MKSHPQALIFVCRYPFDGPVKTRLAKSIGSQNAANFYAAVLRDLFSWASTSDQFDLLVSLANGQNCEIFANEFTLPIDSFFGQVGDDFNARLAHSLQVAFDLGFTRAAVAASDSPELTHEDVVQIFNALDTHDISIIPSPDGGYTGLAMKEPLDVFTGVKMSTAVVLEQTLSLVKNGNWTAAVLTPVPDVDEVEEFERLAGLLAESPKLRARLPHITQFVKENSDRK